MFRFTDLFSPESSYNKVKIYWKSPSFVLHIPSVNFNSMGIVLIIKSESFSLSDYNITEHYKSIILLYFGLAIHSSRNVFYVVSYLIFRWYSDSNKMKHSRFSRRRGYFFFRSCASSCSWVLHLVIFCECCLLNSEEESKNVNSLIKVLE